jgi:large subunit ribosomal protein L27
MAHKTGSGSTKNNRDSRSKRLGLKVSSNQLIKRGMILIRQRGLTYKPGLFVKSGKDYTLYALKDGKILFNFGNIIDII